MTGAVFSVVLDPSIQLRGEAVLVNTLFRIVAPIVYVVGWLVLGRRRDWDARSALLAFVPPVVWLVLTFIRGAATGWYPYPFLDVSVHGPGLPLAGAAAVLLLAAIVAGIVLAVDRWLPSLAWASKSVRSR